MGKIFDEDKYGAYPLGAMLKSGSSNRRSGGGDGPRPVDLEAAGRIPPQAVDVEAYVLGAMLIEREAVTRALEVLGGDNPDVFYRDAHQKIYNVMVTLFDRGEPVDSITLLEELRRRGQVQEVGGAFYLTELTSKVTSAANIEYHARIIMEKSLLRKLITVSGQISSIAYQGSEDAFGLLDEAEQQIFAISQSHLRKGFVPIKPILMQAFEQIEANHNRAGGVTGVPSGMTALDDILSGFQPSDLIIVAARPSMGKTAFTLSAARNAAVDHNIAIGFFSLEMSSTQLAMRLLCAEARVDAHAVRTGRLPDADWMKLSTKVGELAKAKLFIDDTPGLSILELRAKARRLKSEHDIKLIIIDYLQLMSGPKSAASREQEIAHISRSLKALAKELNVPVIALSQLSRAVEQRGGDKRPILSDLRESGSIEQDADVVLFLHRPEKYNITVDEDGNSTEGIAEIIVGKQRNGPIGHVKVAFVKDYARFENLATQYNSADYLLPAADSYGAPAPPLGGLAPSFAPPPDGDAPF